MIEIIVSSSRGRSRLICPSCGGHNMAIIEAPRKCDLCDKELPNMVALLNDSWERANWHWVGKTVSRLRTARYFHRV